MFVRVHMEVSAKFQANACSARSMAVLHVVVNVA